jgi:hypothetical protein
MSCKQIPANNKQISAKKNLNLFTHAALPQAWRHAPGPQA